MIFLVLQASTVAIKRTVNHTKLFLVHPGSRKQTEKRTDGLHHYHVVCYSVIMSSIFPTSPQQDLCHPSCVSPGLLVLVD